MLGTWEIIFTLFVVLLLFGGKRLPELARSLGQGIREFKKASNEISSEIEVETPSQPEIDLPKQKERQNEQETAS